LSWCLNASEGVKWDYLCRAKVLLHAAVNEHFGLVVAEAQATGAVPVVHRSGGTWSDIVEYDRYGFGYLNHAEAVDAMVKLLTNDDLYRRYSIRARRHSLQFTYDAFKMRLIRYVNVALGLKPT